MDQFADPPPVHIGTHTASGEVSLGGMVTGGTAAAYIKHVAEVGTAERDIIAYRLGLGGGPPHNAAETTQHYGIGADDLASLEQRFERLTATAQSVEARLDALHQFNTKVMQFRLGFVDGWLHTLLEVCDRFGLTLTNRGQCA